MQFRKKQVIVEAEQYQPFKNIRGVIEVRRVELSGGTHSPVETVKQATIETLEGEMQVSPGDWIITGVQGERYPCKPDIFEATYERVE